jgi:hypothetical protein
LAMKLEIRNWEKHKEVDALDRGAGAVCHIF